VAGWDDISLRGAMSDVLLVGDRRGLSSRPIAANEDPRTWGLTHAEGTTHTQRIVSATQRQSLNSQEGNLKLKDENQIYTHAAICLPNRRREPQKAKS
jgi:S1-C subfamily serine protease